MPRFVLRALLALAMTACALGCWVTQARADGDPASDVLAGQSLFLPQDAGVTASQQTQLTALLAAAERDGYRIRTAVVASPVDLGSVGELWRQPQTYAHFLGQELSIVYRGTLLVVMPNGYGVYGVGGAPADPSALRGLSTPNQDLGSAAIAGIRRLAANAGHRLPLPPSVSVTQARSGDWIPWLVFGIGLILIAAAWTVSLRVRPLGTPSPHQNLST